MFEEKNNYIEGWDHRGYIGEKMHYFIVNNALCDKSIRYHAPYFDKDFIPDIDDAEYSDYCVGCIRLLKIRLSHRDIKSYFVRNKDV
jgi:hypothetical protein